MLTLIYKLKEENEMSYMSLNVVSIQIKKANVEKLTAWVRDFENIRAYGSASNIDIIKNDDREEDAHYIKTKRYRKEWFDIFFESSDELNHFYQDWFLEGIARMFDCYVNISSITSWCCPYHESYTMYMDNWCEPYYKNFTGDESRKWPRHIGMYFWNWVNLDEI